MDEYVASARSHWGPRFTANGVPAADFDRVMGGLESWGDWCTAWSDAARAHEASGTRRSNRTGCVRPART